MRALRIRPIYAQLYRFLLFHSHKISIIRILICPIICLVSFNWNSPLYSIRQRLIVSNFVQFSSNLLLHILAMPQSLIMSCHSLGLQSASSYGNTCTASVLTIVSIAPCRYTIARPVRFLLFDLLKFLILF